MVEKMLRAIQRIPSPLADVQLEARDLRNWTALHMACERDGAMSFARLLIGAKSDVNARVPGTVRYHVSIDFHCSRDAQTRE